ncbi:YibE/F family protein [Inediibacterium massiliense]|uniref:YibE/F family protein n=1 Tax=Inediibacterium massiliense TaxID=1658111 RepID=UPI0006B6056E|nr:YibE/F family protein [Inediibacterium massiliense]
MKKILLALMICILSFQFIYAQDVNEEIPSSTENAVILDCSKIQKVKISEGYTEAYQYVKLKVMSGKYKGKIYEIDHSIPDNSTFAIPVKVGDKVIIDVEEENNHVNIVITEYMRQHYIIYLYIIFILLIILIGRKKGIKAVITLTLTILAILKVLLPMILKGVNPIPITIFISIGITILTMVIIAGVNSKSIAGIIGTSGGVIIAGIIAYYIGSQVKLTGMSSEEANMLLFIPQKINFDFKDLLFSGMIMGALGAVMDIGMSISSSIEEIHKANPSMSTKELFRAGMNVGTDVMGTMTNTLILAYTGSSIPLLLLFMAYETSIVKILNLDIIATEVVRSLAGSIGLVLTIPLTAIVASVLIKREKKS